MKNKNSWIINYGVDVSHLNETYKNDKTNNSIFSLRKDALKCFEEINKHELKSKGFNNIELRRLTFSNTIPSYCISQKIEKLIQL